MSIYDNLLPRLPSIGARARQASPRLSEQDERSLAGRLATRAGSGVAAAGNLLDLPGSTIRDVAGGLTTGDWQRFNPIDQWLTPFTDQNRVTGRELGREWGWIGPDDNWRNFIGGMGIEFGLDPLTPMTGLFGGGARTTAGKAAQMAGLDPIIRHAAKKAGKTGWRQYGMTGSLDDLVSRLGDPLFSMQAGRTIQATDATRNIAEAASKLGVKNLDELMKQPLRGMVGFGMPFVEPSKVVGFGPTAQKIAGTFDTLGEGLRYAPGVRHARGLFSPAAGGQFTSEGQKLAESVYDLNKWADYAGASKWMGSQEAVRSVRQDFLQNNRTAFQQPGMAVEAVDQRAGEAFSKMMRFASELQAIDVPGTARRVGDPVEEAFQRFVPGFTGQVPAGQQQAWKTAIDGMKSVKDEIFDQLKAKGIKTADLEGSFQEVMIRHFPRYAKDQGYQGLGKRITPASGQAVASRRAAIAGVPADVVDELLVDPAFRVQGVGAAGVRDQILNRNEYRRFLPADDDLASAAATELGEFVKGHAAEKIFEKGTFAEDLLTYMKSAYRLDASSSGAYSYLLDAVDAGATGPTVTLRKAIDGAGFDFTQAQQYIQRTAGKAITGDEMVPKELADAVTSVIRPHASPEWAEALKSTIGAFNSFFKQRVTLPYPAFWFRNHTSGHYLNFTGGGHVNSLSDLSLYGSEYARSWRTYMGKANGISPADLADMRATGLTGVHGFMDVNFMAVDPTEIVPQQAWRFGDTAREAAQHVADNPSIVDKIPFGQAARKGEQVVLRSGAKAARFSEFLTRAPMYTYLRKKGYSPFAAAQEVKKLQFDYSALTPFEKDAMRQLVPFYTFARKMSGLLADELIQRPGGRMAASIRTAARMHESDATTPDYVAGKASVPLGQQADGTQRYLTGFGLPWEDPLGFFSDPTKPGAFTRQMGLEGLARTSPLFKAPLEWATGASFFQRGPGGGRDLIDMDPALGRLAANIRDLATGERTGSARPIGGNFTEQLAVNLPYTRALTTLRQLTDPRKYESRTDQAMLAGNLLTGLRFSHISPAAQDAKLRELADARYRELGGRGFTRMHTPDEVRERLPVRSQRELEMLDQLYNTMADRAKARREMLR